MKYSKLLIIASILSVLLFIGACQGQIKSICGDKVCDTTESCACTDCASDPKCQQTTPTSTSPLKEVESCGDGKCVDNERCDPNTHQTICPKDCTLECPAFMKVSEFSCATEASCKQTSSNSFTIIGSSVIQTTVENIGERGSGDITTRFKCGVTDLSVVSRDGDQLFGITFRDYFNSADETVSLSGWQSETGSNKGIYKFAFDIPKLERPVDLNCEISLQALPFNYLKTLKISFK